MPIYLDTRGQPTLGIALCSRCQTKRMLSELTDDGNIPNFKVCRKEISPGCWDNYDPMRLPPRRPDNYSLPFVRPDTDLVVPLADEAQLPIEPPTQYD